MSKKDLLLTLGYLNNTKSKSVQNALASLKDLRSQIKQMADRSYPSHQIEKVKAFAMEAIKKDLFEANKLELNTFNEQMEQLKQYYLKDYQNKYDIHSREIEAYNRRLNAMSKAELEKEAGKYLNGEFPKDIDSNIIDELSIALKSNGYDGFDSLREVMIKNQYDKPWKHSEVGEYLDKHISARNGNLDSVVGETETGELFSLSLDSLNDFFDAEEKEAHDE